VTAASVAGSTVLDPGSWEPDVSQLPDGWLGLDEARALARLAKGRTVLEIGAFLGRSTVAMARTATLVVSVDHHRGSAEHQPIAGAGAFVPWTIDPADPAKIDTARQFLANLAHYGVRDRVMAVVADASLALPLLAPRSFGLAFVDGGHDYETARRDIEHALRLVGPDSFVVCHDGHDAEVRRAIDAAALAQSLAPILVAGSLVALRTPP